MSAMKPPAGSIVADEIDPDRRNDATHIEVREGRVVVVALNQGGFDFTEVDVARLIAFIRSKAALQRMLGLVTIDRGLVERLSSDDKDTEVQARHELAETVLDQLDPVLSAGS